MKIIGIDYGTKRIGVALSDESATIAFPLATIAAGPHAVSEIHDLVQKNAVQTVVVGESRNFAGEKNAVMEDIEQFKKDLEKLAGVGVVYQQELFTSAQAARQFAPDESRKKNPEHTNLDASAAALILQSYLDKMKTNGAH